MRGSEKHLWSFGCSELSVQLKDYMTCVSAWKFCFGGGGVAGGSNSAKALTQGKLHGEHSALGEALIRRGRYLFCIRVFDNITGVGISNSSEGENEAEQDANTSFRDISIVRRI